MTTRPVTAALVVTAIALSGCGRSGDPPKARPDSPGRAPESTPVTGPPPETRRVVCDGERRVSGTVDYARESAGAPTPEQAVLGWLQPAADEHLALDERSDKAEVYVVRSDGSVSGVLDLIRTSSGGWVVETLEACEGALRRHPAAPDGG